MRRDNPVRRPSLACALALVLILAHGALGSPASLEKLISQDKLYAYVCLASKKNLCLGVSPGPGNALPYVGMPLQVKSQMSNAQSQMDWKKMRWDFGANWTSLTLTNISNLCVDLQTPTTDPLVALNRMPLVLNDCTSDKHTVWEFDVYANVLRYKGTQWCMTVHQCQPHRDAVQSCTPGAQGVVTSVSDLVPGASVHLNGCFDTVPGNAIYAVSQVFALDFDCNVGCSPYLLSNGVCDIACNVSHCAYDNGMCLAMPPTMSGTLNPATAEYEYADGGNGSVPGGGGGGSGPHAEVVSDGEGISEWFALAIIMFVACLAVFVARKRRRELDRQKRPMHDMADGDSVVGEQVRFESTAAVALNQLRYHTRVGRGDAVTPSRVQPEGAAAGRFDEVHIT